MFEVTECPQTYIGEELIEAINIAGTCQNGYLPVAGGLFDQSAWFISLWHALNADQDAIQREQMKRGSSHDE